MLGGADRRDLKGKLEKLPFRCWFGNLQFARQRW
jgi:hypothetical protein